MIVAENVIVSDTAGVRRRTVLAGGAVAAAGAGLALAAPAWASTPVFRHGVASGDPLPDAVIIWTRVTVAEDATPGSGTGAAAAVRWEVAADENFAAITASGSATATADSDHTVKVDVTGLAPGCVYFYRFTALGRRSPVGRTRTAPALGATPDRLRFGVVSCANWEAGFFAAYRHLADRGDLDAIVHLGDYLYEYGRGEYGGRIGSARPHDPVHEIVSLADYRIRHAQYKTDPDLQRLHALLPFICTWDDHESADNSWSGGSGKHDPASQGSWADRRAASARAYLEWMPVRASRSGSGVQIYRRLRFGTLAELSMLDLRSYRDQEVKPGAGWREVDNPERTLTGRAQMDWLTAGLASSTARWKLVGNSVMIAPLVFPPLDPATTAAFTQAFGVPQSGLPVNADQWDGYTADRARLYRAIAEHGVSDVVFLTGDIHSSWAADLPVNAADPAGPGVGAEFVVPSVTSSSLGEVLQAPPRTAAVPVEEAIKGVNRHLRYVELDSHGFGVLEVTAAQAQMDWFYVLDVADARTGVRHGASFAVPAGGRMEPRTAPAS
ncbi:alkaline phosphatase D family protein [Nocardia cyriacigeorgica]|uniref:alkaline phosphatase D family protein n=1 Tax=Nocardia cyriacigeorgica TaxID=135487 RepID=UPI001894E4C7|nr:alkaline phosphatase D family protein [Nocardia cyriacigeorgica]MBF6158369.1 alkaline phosphatase D family protein [Nocardia cyriacigeorgica]MBF6197942.1 alkaline phosphatase D family protein [Nocardia cyriacigeorgica]MBF6513782.1 alkaline phosphatase D family protein [Nocardia cyriacigeorgica]